MITKQKTVLFLTTLLCHVAAYAEPVTNKCTDGYKITYANMPCEKLGLKTVGHVRNKITVIPALKEFEKTSSKEIGEISKTRKESEKETGKKTEYPDPEKSEQESSNQ